MTKKRLLCVFLSIIMLLGVFPVSAFGVNNNDNTIRYTVLILDTSGSMSGTPASVQKQAAIKFCESLASANGTNYIALVKINTSSSLVRDFTTDITALETYIKSLPASGGTNINQSLTIADNLLSSVDEAQNDIIKNIVLCSDGLPESGSYSYTGPYTSSDYYDYEYANSVYDTANKLKEEYTIYTLGFFHDLYGSELAFGRRFMNDIQNGGYYEVTNVDELEFTFGEIADDIINEVKEITFTYQSGKDYTATCYYTDDYFSESSYTYKPSLATMSLSFAMSAFGSSEGGSDYSNKSKNAKKLLNDIGVLAENIETNEWFTKKPTTDSIGVIAGNKPITVKGEDYTLIAVAVRGGGYEQEWASNFTIGTTGQHSGFNTAKNNVINFLKSYIANPKITGAVKFWITGYSRAAATANLVAGALDDGTSVGTNISYDYNDIYTYCFETPAGALASQVKGQARYKNIFNIINSSDPVPYVAPAAMGFARYGVDKYLPSAESDPNNYETLKDKMLKVYNNLSSTDSYIVDDFQMKKLAVKNWLPGGKKISFVQDDTKNNYSQGLFLSNYVTILSNEFIKDRDNYTYILQDEIREICSVMFGCTDAQAKVLIDSIVEQAKDNWGSLAWSYVWNTGINPGGTEYDALQIVSDWLKKAIKDAGITNYNDAMIDAAGKNLADLMIALILNHPNYFTTAIMNGSGLGAAHYPELCYSWLASMDTNYTEGAKEKFNNGGYRIVRINCPVDINVYDENNNIVASIKNEEPVSLSNNSSYIYGVDADDQKYVVLPVNSNYRISITARENSQVNYGIDEYSALAGAYTRNINYFNIDLKQGESITGIIPSYSEIEVEEDTPNGSNTKYLLLNKNDEDIVPDSDLSGKAEYYTITVKSSNASGGVAVGSGMHKYGSFAQIEAVAADGYKFSGWYSNGKCISSDNVYRLCVKDNIELIAKFDSDSCTHQNTELRNVSEATCSANGYTGDLYCLECKTIVEYGRKISVTGFVDTDGDGLCDECGIDEDNHVKVNKSIFDTIKNLIQTILKILEIVFLILKKLNVGNGPYADLLSVIDVLQRTFGFV